MASKKKLKKGIIKLYSEVAQEIISGIELFGNNTEKSVELLNGLFDKMDEFLSRVSNSEVKGDRKATKANYNQLQDDVNAHIQEIAGKVQSIEKKSGK